MKPPLRIAVLECDSPLDKTRERYGTYTGVFTALLLAGAAELWPDEPSPNAQLVITGHDVVKAQTYPHLEDIDAVLMTGSRFTSFDDDPWILKLVDFIRMILFTQSRVRIVGICFGHQILGRALSAPLKRNTAGWEISVLPVPLTPAGSKLFGDAKELRLMQMHRDIVAEWPRSVRAADGGEQEIERIGATKVCAVQGMHIKGRFFSVQGHPEFTEGIMRELLETRHKAGIFDDTQYEDGLMRVGDKQDGVVVAVAILRFLLED